MLTTIEKKIAYHAGFDDYQSGYDLKYNPFTKPTDFELAQEWIRGWNYGQENYLSQATDANH